MAGMVPFNPLLVISFFLALWIIDVLHKVLGTSAIGMRNPALPPFILRFGFGLIFTGAGYMISTGDVENGSATAACKFFSIGICTLLMTTFLLTIITSMDGKLVSCERIAQGN